MNKFEKLIRDGFVEIDTSRNDNFERAIERCTMLKVNKVCSKTEAHLILVGKNDERDRVEIISGNTYYYDPLKWVLSKSVVDDDINKGRKDDSDANDKKEVERKMDEFKNLINNGFAEIDTARSVSFELAIEIGKELNPYLRSQPKLSKKSVSEDNRFILLGKEDERDQVEMRRGMTYFYNPTMWRVKSLDNEYEINKGWHDEIELDERSKEILDSIWPVIYGRVMQMIDCGQ